MVLKRTRDELSGLLLLCEAATKRPKTNDVDATSEVGEAVSVEVSCGSRVVGVDAEYSILSPSGIRPVAQEPSDDCSTEAISKLREIAEEQNDTEMNFSFPAQQRSASTCVGLWDKLKKVNSFSFLPTGCPAIQPFDFPGFAADGKPLNTASDAHASGNWPQKAGDGAENQPLLSVFDCRWQALQHSLVTI